MKPKVKRSYKYPATVWTDVKLINFFLRKVLKFKKLLPLASRKRLEKWTVVLYGGINSSTPQNIEHGWAKQKTNLVKTFWPLIAEYCHLVSKNFCDSDYFVFNICSVRQLQIYGEKIFFYQSLGSRPERVK